MTAENTSTVEKVSADQNRAKYYTTCAYLSGGICGRMWMPAAMAGKPINKNLRGIWGFFAKGDSFRDALNSLLMREGGDFQNAEFTADTVLHVERRHVESPGKYTVHVWERELSALRDCADLVNSEAYVSDFLGEED